MANETEVRLKYLSFGPVMDDRLRRLVGGRRGAGDRRGRHRDRGARDRLSRTWSARAATSCTAARTSRTSW